MLFFGLQLPDTILSTNVPRLLLILILLYFISSRARREKEDLFLCTNVLLQDRGRRKKLHEASCVVLQGTCCTRVGIWKNKDALMCSLCENQLKSMTFWKVNWKI